MFFMKKIQEVPPRAEAKKQMMYLFDYKSVNELVGSLRNFMLMK